MDELSYLALAYGVIWLGLMGYLAHVSRQVLSVREELNVFRSMLASQGREGEPARDGESTAPAAEPLTGGDERPSRGDV
jgi:CcmD family protein